MEFVGLFFEKDRHKIKKRVNHHRKEKIHMRSTRVFAAFLAVMMVLPVFCSCKKSKAKDPVVVKEDDVWYDSVRFTVDPPEVSDEERVSVDSISFRDDKVYAAFRAVNKNDYTIINSYLVTYDYSGERSSVRVKFPCEDEPDILLRIEGIYPDSNGTTATVIVERSYVNVMEWVYCFATMDLATGETSELTPIDDIDGDVLYVYDIYEIKGLVCIMCNRMNSEDFTPILFFYKDHELVNKIDMTGNKDLKDLQFIEKLEAVAGSDLVQISGYAQEGNLYFKLDPSTGAVSDIELRTYKEMAEFNNSPDLIDKYSYDCTYEGEYVKTDSIGNIFRYDGNEQKEELVLNCNQYSPFFTDYLYSASKVVSYTPDRVCMMTETGDMAGMSDGSCTVTVLTRASVNPNAGKKVIEIDGLRYCSDYLALAVYEFNKTDSEYLIRVWSGGEALAGTPQTSSYIMVSSADDYRSMMEQIIEDQVAEDNLKIERLKDNDVADIVIDLPFSSGIDKELITDLTDLIEPDVEEKLFGNIIDAVKDDGRLYYVPVTIAYSGIVCKTEDVPEGSCGFTFEQFSDFISGPNNGSSIYVEQGLEDLRTSFFMSCLDLDSYIDGDKADFDTEEFRKAASYAKDNFQGQNDVPEDIFMEFDNVKIPNARYADIGSYLQFVGSCKATSKPYVTMGMPSVDGRGPSFTVTESMAIPSGAASKDGAVKFMNYLLKGGFTDDDTTIGSIVINRDVIEKQIPLVNTASQKLYSSYLSEGMPISLVQAMGINLGTDVTGEQFLKDLENLSVCSLYYGEADLVIRTEIQAYFAGDKSIDDVIVICNDKISTMLSERS